MKTLQLPPMLRLTSPEENAALAHRRHHAVGLTPYGTFHADRWQEKLPKLPRRGYTPQPVQDPTSK